MTESVQMVAMPPLTKPRNFPPGGILRTDHDGLVHHIMCPCGCGKLWSARHAVQGGSVETGDLSLTPSLVMAYTDPETYTTIGCGWHGFLTNGVFTSV